jgi:perosamine synthetase
MSAPDIGEPERRAVAEVLGGQWLSGGPTLGRFEAVMARRADRRHAVAVSSGTAGLHAVVRALGIGRGDRVVTTSYSFVASVNCFLYEGAEPIFADIDPRTYNVDPAAVEDAIRHAGVRPVAILPVDIFGQPAALERLMRIAHDHDLRLIEDSCEALGSAHRGHPAGSFGDAGVFAFYPNKQMTTGEGGVIVTDDDALAGRCRALRNQGRLPGDDWLTHSELGYNYRLDDLSAAVGLAQSERLDELLAARERVASAYTRALAGVAGVEPPYVEAATTRMSWFVYVITLDRSLDRGTVATVMSDRGVPTRPYFRPIHQQPYFVARFGDLTGSLPVTEDIGRRTLALPFHGRLSDESVAYVVDALREAIAR